MHTLGFAWKLEPEDHPSTTNRTGLIEANTSILLKSVSAPLISHCRAQKPDYIEKQTRTDRENRCTFHINSGQNQVRVFSIALCDQTYTVHAHSRVYLWGQAG